MTTTNDDARDAALPDELTEDPDLSPLLVAVVSDPAEGPVECTIFPSDAAGSELITTWMTAREGSFVDLAAMR
ncbi:MAG: transcriptional regulator [Haloarculaceae archaeon]